MSLWIEKAVSYMLFIHVGTDVINVFIKKASEAWRRIRETIPSFPMHITPASEKLFQEATHCQICKKRFSPKSCPKVRHHSHQKEVDNLITGL